MDSVVEDLWEETPTRSTHINHIQTSADDGLHQLVERFWAQEHVSILPERDTAPSVEDQTLLSKLDRETYQDADGHYVVPMLWSSKFSSLPNNSPMAKKRWRYLRRRLRNDPELYRLYKAVIDGYIETGFARRLSAEEAAKVSDRTWTIPHHPVVNVNKPGEIRIVNDAAAAFEGVSLNAALKTGPDLLSSLVGIIIRFRTNPVAIAADIKAMFHQVRVNEKDRDSLRFLWTDDIHSDADPYVMQMLVHIFGATDSPCCANYAVKRTARDYQHKFQPLTFETALRAFYVDDLLKSVLETATAIRLAEKLGNIIECGGFFLTKFMSNCCEVLHALPPSRVSSKLKLDLNTEDIQRALGISWDINSDTFTFSPKRIEALFTKRAVVRTTCSFFDPMGFITPFILIAKILVQELWRRGFGWVDPLDEETSKCWNRWLAATENVSLVSIPRCYSSHFEDPIAEVQLHVFGDASELALNSALLSLPLVFSRQSSDLPVEGIYFWTDSTLTLQYIFTCGES